MALEFIEITPGSGKKVAVDKVNDGTNDLEFQIVKILLGADNAIDNLVDSGQQVAAASIPVVLASDVNVKTEGTVAHGASNSGNPTLQGLEAIAHGTNPTAVTAGQRTKAYANRAGIPFVVGGHPNVVTLEHTITGAQTDVAVISVSAGTKIVVTQAQLIADNANTAFPQVRVGFGAANTPTTTGDVLSHPGVPAGGGVSRGDGSGILGIGADGDDLRITNGAPTGGSMRLLVSYYTIES
jgi:hypothetical protein